MLVNCLVYLFRSDLSDEELAIVMEACQMVRFSFLFVCLSVLNYTLHIVLKSTGDEIFSC